MGRRTLVAIARDDGRFDCRLAHWGADADPLTQSRPLAAGCTAPAVAAEVDATYERVVVTDGTVSSYAVCWLDPTLDDVADVVLAAADDLDALRDWWVGAKSLTCDAVARGEIDRRTARDGLLTAIHEYAGGVYPPDDASFLRNGR